MTSNEKEARTFIEDVVGEQLKGDLQSELKSGVILCKLMNKLKPGSIFNINNGKMSFMMMDNIQSYINACKKHGIPQSNLFVIADLFEGKKHVPSNT